MVSKKNAAEKEPVQQNLSGAFAIPADEVTDFTSEQISFPPYWNPFVGAKLLATPISLDDRDPDFPRFVLEARHSITCQRGGADDKEEIVVAAGEFFTMSVYAGLPLERFVGCKCLIECTGTRDVNRPQPMFVFDLKLGAEDKKLLNAERKERAAAAVARFKQSRIDAANAPKEMTAEVVNSKPAPVQPRAPF